MGGSMSALMMATSMRLVSSLRHGASHAGFPERAGTDGIHSLMRLVRRLDRKPGSEL